MTYPIMTTTTLRQQIAGLDPDLSLLADEAGIAEKRLSIVIACLPHALKLALAKEVARISEQSFRRGAQQAAYWKLDPSLAYDVRFNVSYDRCPIYIGNFAKGQTVPMFPQWSKTSISRVAMEAPYAKSPILADLMGDFSEPM